MSVYDYDAYPEYEIPDDFKRPDWKSSCIEQMKEFDMFGVKPQIEIRGKKKIKSFWGAFVSIIVFGIICFYSTYKFG